ncbi:MAG TPA: hypothetical protein VJP85_05915 [Candidatus Baltobacteraceae bacterium]|nr:hypothetical protein [Candidatus Baltobacteraceae bacterium]
MEGHASSDHAALIAIHRAVRRVIAHFEEALDKRNPDSTLRRQLHLFQRYILDQQDPSELARELGLSMRQFYRDYRLIRDRILDAMPLPLPHSAVTAEWLSADDLSLQQSRLLIEAGLISEAKTALHALARDESAEPETRARALCELADAETDHGNYQEAQRILYGVPEISTSPEINAARALQGEILRWSSAGAFGVPGPGAAALDIPMRVALNERRWLETSLNWAIFKAVQADWAGESETVLRALNDARALIDAMPRQTMRQRLIHARVYAGALWLKSIKNAPRAIAILNASLTQATTHGFARSAVHAAASLAACYSAVGDHEKARELSLETMRAAGRIQAPDLIAWTNLQLPHYRSPEETLENLKTVERLYPPRDYRHQILYYLMSTACTEMGDTESALSYAQLAWREATHSGYPRSMAIALRQLALAQFETGDVRSAEETVNEAIAGAERLQFQHTIAAARALKERIVKAVSVP